MEALLERETLKRRLDFLREKNKRLENTSAILNSECFNDVDALKSKISEFKGPFISQVHPYKPFPSKAKPMVIEPTTNMLGTWVFLLFILLSVVLLDAYAL